MHRDLSIGKEKNTESLGYFEGIIDGGRICSDAKYCFLSIRRQPGSSFSCMPVERDIFRYLGVLFM